MLISLHLRRNSGDNENFVGVGAVIVTIAVVVFLSTVNVQGGEPPRPHFSTANCFEKERDDGDGESKDLDLDRLSQCIQKTLDDLWPQLGAGIPELNLPPLDPYEFGEFTFQMNASDSGSATLGQRLGFGRSSRLTIGGNFTNVVVHNLTNRSSLKVKVNTSGIHEDSDMHVVDYEMWVPNLFIEGNYSLLAEGVPIFRKIEGDGPFWVESNGLVVKGTLKLHRAPNLEQGDKCVKGSTCLDGEEPDDDDETDVTVGVKGIELQLLNLFGGNPVLGAAVNRRLNLHSLELFDEIKPQITAEIGVLIKRITSFIM